MTKTAFKVHFGVHVDKDIRDVPTGYLRHCVKTFEVRLPDKYRAGKTEEAIHEEEEAMKDFLSAAQDEIERRRVSN